VQLFDRGGWILERARERERERERAREKEREKKKREACIVKSSRCCLHIDSSSFPPHPNSNKTKQNKPIERRWWRGSDTKENGGFLRAPPREVMQASGKRAVQNATVHRYVYCQEGFCFMTTTTTANEHIARPACFTTMHMSIGSFRKEFALGKPKNLVEILARFAFCHSERKEKESYFCLVLCRGRQNGLSTNSFQTQQQQPSETFCTQKKATAQQPPSKKKRNSCKQQYRGHAGVEHDSAKGRERIKGMKFKKKARYQTDPPSATQVHTAPRERYKAQRNPPAYTHARLVVGICLLLILILLLLLLLLHLHLHLHLHLLILLVLLSRFVRWQRKDHIIF